MRNTDNDWKIIGDLEPYYGVLSNERYLKKNITPQTIKEFYESGEGDINHAISTLKILNTKFAPKSALDFGCGAGRLLAAMSRNVDVAYGVDISDGMLKLLGENLSQMGISNYKLSSEIPDVQVDWVNSLIVLQHIPTEVGYSIIEKLWSILKVGGGFSIHFPVYRDSGHLHEIFRDVKACTYDGNSMKVLSLDTSANAGSMSMYDYDFAKVLSILDMPDGARILLEHVNHGGCHGVKLYAIKA